MKEFKVVCRKCGKECKLNLLEYNGFFIKTWFCSKCKNGITRASEIEDNLEDYM